jgi:hypothetical protein
VEIVPELRRRGSGGGRVGARRDVHLRVHRRYVPGFGSLLCSVNACCSARFVDYGLLWAAQD